MPRYLRFVVSRTSVMPVCGALATIQNTRPNIWTMQQCSTNCSNSTRCRPMNRLHHSRPHGSHPQLSLTSQCGRLASQRSTIPGHCQTSATWVCPGTVLGFRLLITRTPSLPALPFARTCSRLPSLSSNRRHGTRSTCAQSPLSPFSNDRK